VLTLSIPVAEQAKASQGRNHDDSEETKVAAKVTMGWPPAA
jgi:hypothetical protein